MSMPSEQQLQAAIEARDKSFGGHPRIARLVEVARHIEAHANEPLPLARLAEIAGLSSSRLHKICRWICEERLFR